MKQLCITSLALIAICISSYGQDKSKFNSEILDLGDGNIINSTLHESGDFVLQEFEVEVKKSGLYYLAAWINGSLEPSDEKLQYRVLVNDEKEEYQIRAGESHPHAIDFGAQMFDLVSGVNKIAFMTRKPICPNVEFIKVSQDEQNRQISSEKYDQFINEISNQTLPDNYAGIKKAAIAEELSQSGLKSAPDPQCNYDYEMEVNFKYSYYTTMLLEDDETFTFETSNITSGTDPVIHVVNKYNPQPSLSWTDDNGGSGYNAKLTVDIGSHGGLYYVFIRKAGTLDGTCSLKVTVGTSTYFHTSNCAVTGSRIQCTKTVSETLNWFTADLSYGDSHIWLEDQTGNPGEIIAYNDDWNVSSDFNWGNNSRIRKNTSTNVRALNVSSHSSYYPTGNCDLYMNCENGSGSVNNPNDAIKADEGSYNCYGWAGGLIADVDPTLENSPWYDPSGDLACFDHYFANETAQGGPAYRYGPPAMWFTRMGANSTNACVALWTISGVIVHASVKKPANDQPHGYDWESKDGGDPRVFHPKNALSGFGSITYYYRYLDYSGKSSKRSAKIPEKVSLENEKQLLLEKMVNAYSDKEIFEELYESWKETWDTPELSLHSSTSMFAKSSQYSALLEHCKEKGKEIWPAIFEKYLDSEEINDVFLLEDLTKVEYSMVIDSIRYKQNEEARRNNTCVSLRTNVVNFIAFLLGEIEQEYGSELKSYEVTDVLEFDDNQSINVYPNPAGNFINIKTIGLHQTKVVISICDLSGKVLKSVSEKVSGEFTYSFNIEDIPDGTYLCRIVSDNVVHIIKLGVIR